MMTKKITEVQKPTAASSKSTSSNTKAKTIQHSQSQLQNEASFFKPDSQLYANHIQNQDTQNKTYITVKYNVGFGNSLTLRGEGANLSWSCGQALKNIKDDEWVWESEHSITDPIQFKVLINDHHYEQGDNRYLIAGQKITYSPNFT